MQSCLLSLLAALCVLRPVVTIAVPRPQEYLSIDLSLLPLSLDPRVTGLRLRHVSTEGGQGETNTLTGARRHRRSFRPGFRAATGNNAFSGSAIDARNLDAQAVAGTVDIMSPTVNSPTGERIASLAVSTEANEENQFILNASGVNASTVYLVVKGDAPMVDGTVMVALQVPVFDPAKASYVLYCAIFDTTEAGPLKAAQCIDDDSEVTDHGSRLFSYNGTSGVIKPLWPTSAAPLDTGSTTTSDEGDQELPEESDPGSPSDSSDNDVPAPQTVSLVFTPDLNSTIPIVNSQASNELESGSDGPTLSSTSSLPAPTPSYLASGAAMSASASTPASTTLPATAEEVGPGTSTSTVDHSPTVTPFLALSANLGVSVQAATVSPLTENSTLTTSMASSTSSSLPPGTAMRRRNMKLEDGAQEFGGNEYESRQGASSGETKRVVDTPYVWKFSSARAAHNDGDFVQ